MGSKISQRVEERFWRSLDKRGGTARQGLSECWIWTSYRNARGYGRTYVSRSWPHVLAHRISFCINNNCSLESIDGWVIRHDCDNPSCCNPDHLQIGTQAENTKDQKDRGRFVSKPRRGSENHNSKLNDGQVRSIIRRLKNGERSRRLAEEFGVTEQLIFRIKKGTCWKHIPRSSEFPSPAPVRGEDASGAKLTLSQVRSIKRRLKRGDVARQLAISLGVHPNTVYGIKNGSNWGWVRV